MLGVTLTIYNGTTPQASLSNIEALWWDVDDPIDFNAPNGRIATASTDANGVINLDISEVSGLAVGGYGFLVLYQKNTTNSQDSLVFSGRVVTSDIASGDILTYKSNWARPPQWPALSDPVSGTEKVQIVAKVNNVLDSIVNSVAFVISADYNVDWGDGTAIEAIAAGVQANHTYDYTNTSLTSTTYGYKCAVITITPQSGSNLTSIDLGTVATSLVAGTTNWLDIVLNAPNCTILKFNNAQNSRLVERIWIGEHSVTTMSLTFYSCNSLQSVPLFDTSAVTNMYQTFYSCYSLQSVPLFDTSAVTTMYRMFYNCYVLQSVPLFDTSAVTNMYQTFYSCYSLQSVPLFDTSAVTDMSYMFYYCYVLLTATLIGTAVGIDYSYCKNIGVNELNNIFTNLATVTVATTITITGLLGATTADQTIATTKGWTVVN